MVSAAKAVESGAGVLYLFGNYGGDRMNFDMAAEELNSEGVETCQVWCTDDVASSQRSGLVRGECPRRTPRLEPRPADNPVTGGAPPPHPASLVPGRGLIRTNPSISQDGVCETQES